MALLGLLLLASAALGSPRVRGLLKTSPALRQLNTPLIRELDAWLFNLRHPVLTRTELGDGSSPSGMRLDDPMGLGRAPDGTIYVSDRGGQGPGHVVWAIAGQSARVIAGDGRRGVAGSGLFGGDVDLGSPQSLSVDLAGRVYLADSYNHVVVRVDPDGGLTRVAGTGEPGSEGDGGPAVEAMLDQPYDARVDERGNLYIADYGNHRIRRVTPAGMIETLAGTGEPGYSGDGGPAVAARLHGPYGVYPDRRYGFLIADSENHVVRRVDSTGTIRTVAGSGVPGNSGDDGPGLAARFNSPQGLAVGPLGEIYIGDEHNHEIRVIDAHGIVHRIAGIGVPGFSADGTPALAARLNDPENIVVLPDRSLLFTEAGSHRVRMVRPDGRLATFAGPGR